MPSLVDFQPLIDASKESARSSQRAAEIRAGSIERGFAQAGQALDIMGQRGKQREKEFHSIFDYDLNKNASKEARGYLANKYRQIKRDGVSMFKENKNVLGYGKLSPEQRIEIDDQMDSFKREAELLNVINQQIGNAEQLGSQRPHAIKVDREKIGRYLELLKPNQEGQYDTEGLAEFLAETNRSPTGQAFTTFGEFDADFHLDQSRSMIRKELKPETSTEEIVIDRGGKRKSVTYETTSYGTDEERRNKYYGMLSSSKDQDMYEYNIGKMLTDDERESAIAEYGNKVTNPMSAYYAFDKADMTTGFEETRRLTKKKTAPAPVGTKGTGTPETVIEKENGTWKLGTTPVGIKTEVNGEPISGNVYEVYEDDSGDKFAKISYKNQYGESVKFEKPLEDVYDELDRAFKRYSKGGLQLEGWEDIVFEDKPEVEEIKTVPEFETKRISLWRSGDKKESYEEAIKFIKENPDDPDAYGVYEALKEKGVIK